MNDPEARVTGRPSGAPGTAHVRREQCAPSAAFAIGWMSAAIATWLGQQREARPACAADDSLVAPFEEALADGTSSREYQIEGGVRARPNDGVQPELSRAARHMTDRSGVTPNHRSKANAACSTSIVSPSIARSPRDRAARTNAVSPRQ